MNWPHWSNVQVDLIRKATELITNSEPVADDAVITFDSAVEEIRLSNADQTEILAACKW